MFCRTHDFNKMNKKIFGIRWKSIALFYVLAVLIRAIVLRYWGYVGSPFIGWLRVWADGIGPCLGALVAVLVFKRKFYCTLTGKSVIKSLFSVAIPLVICFLLDRNLGFILMGTLIYSLLEEVGWRGYLQGELKEMNRTLSNLLIATMWFFWHIAIRFDLGGLIFFSVLLLGAWGIGNIARDTRSLMACACFHTLFNFSNQGYFHFSPTIIALYVVVIVSWFIIWYLPWKETVLRLTHLNNKRP